MAKAVNLDRMSCTAVGASRAPAMSGQQHSPNVEPLRQGHRFAGSGMEAGTALGIVPVSRRPSRRPHGLHRKN